MFQRFFRWLKEQYLSVNKQKKELKFKLEKPFTVLGMVSSNVAEFP